MNRIIAALAVGVLTAAPVAADEEEFKKLKGTWEIVKALRGGEDYPDAVGDTLAFDGEKVTVTIGGNPMAGTATLDAKQDPKQLTLKPDEEGAPTLQGIYKIEGDEMTLALGRQQRPTAFESKAGEMALLFTLKKKTD